MKLNYHNYRTRNDIDSKLGPVIKLDNGNKTTSKNFDHGIILENCDVIDRFQFTANFEQSRSRIPDAFFH